MSGNRVVKTLIGLLLIVAIDGLCTRLIPPERLLRQRMVRVLDYERDEDTNAYWLDAQTLLLVTGKSETSQNHPLDVPAHWKGKVQRLNIHSGKRTPDPGLTKMLNSLYAEPMSCSVAPDGHWLLWQVAYTSDHYPNSIVSTLDGKRNYAWAADKFEYKYWVNSHQWVHHQSAQEANAGLLDLSHLYVYDVYMPKKEQKLSIHSAQARALIASSSPDGKEYELQSEEGEDSHMIWHLAVYDVCDHYFIAAPKPLRTLPLKFLPFDITQATAFVSPDYRHVTYTLHYNQVIAWQAWLHHFISQVPAPEKRKTCGLWVSRIDGSELHEIGHMAATDDAMIEFQWLPDNRHVSWLDESGLYIVSVE